MFLTPELGLPVAEPEDPTREYPATVDAPAKAILDSLIGANRDVGSSAEASGTLPGSLAPSTQNIIDLTQIDSWSGRLPWVIADGALIAPYTGIYLLIYQCTVADFGGGVAQQIQSGNMGRQNVVHGYSASNTSFVNITLPLVLWEICEADAPILKPAVYANTAMGTGTAMLSAIFMANRPYFLP